MKSATIICLMLLILFLGVEFTAAQQVDFDLNDWGRIRLYDAGGTRIIDRVSINVGRSATAVHDYKDVGGVRPIMSPMPVTATIADSELVSIIDYDTSAIAVKIAVKHHIFWWKDKNYFLVRFCVYNQSETITTPFISFQMAPQVAGSYGDEMVDYITTEPSLGYAYKTDSYVGYSILSQPTKSFRSMFYSDYSAGSTFPDDVMWNEMTALTNTTFPFDATSDGSMNHLNAGQTVIAPGDSVDYVLFMGYSSTLNDLKTQYQEALDIYDTNFKGTPPANFALNVWGRIRLYDALDTRQIDRISINVGRSADAVHDYKDVGGVRPIAGITQETPTLADAERAFSIDYDTSAIATKIRVDHRLYAWSDKGFLIVKFDVINQNDTTVDPYISFQMAPQTGGSYGDEMLDWDGEMGLGYSYKTGAYGGYKLLSQNATSFRSMFYSDYSQSNTFPDNLMWNEMIATENTAYPFDATSDGSMNHLNAGQVSLAPGESAHYILFIGFATTLEGLKAQTLEAQAIHDVYFAPTGVETFADLPETFMLGHNYPNPFNPSTTIPFVLERATPVKLDVYNLRGQLVRSIFDGRLQAGSYEMIWDGRDQNGLTVVSGLYLYRLQTDAQSQTGKMVLTK
ncbi:T9SS type A sorting domain-containing protein [candidate division KSB1 bacterium]|nr:T9SS type A sorting domain-containing protein [candidate division KSB1 bacterium]